MRGAEPCPERACRYHLHGDARPAQIAAAPTPRVTCTLKIAEGGAIMTLEEVGIAMGLTRERVRQIADKGLQHLLRNMQRLRVVLRNMQRLRVVGVKRHDD
jgi:hypothetical protein